jgi:hypothetical protein
MARATPERLLTRGTIVPGVTLVMRALQLIYPRRTYPAVDAASDLTREAKLAPEGWVLGGTSPGGAPLGLVKGNYFIGDPNVERDGPPPQRIVWVPPDNGEERYVAPQRLGNMIGGAPPGTPQLMRRPDEPADWLPGAAARPLGPHVGRQVYTRVIPMRAHCWGSDMDDTEELADNLAAATELVLGGTQMPLNAPIVTGGGFLRDTLGNRGLCYVLRVNFYAPIFSPMLDSAQMRDLSMIVTAKTGGNG